MHKSQSRNTRNVTKPGNMTPPNVNNPTVIHTKDSEEEKSPEKELKSMTITIITKIKEDMYKKKNELKENTNKQLKGLKDNTNKQLIEFQQNTNCWKM
jgi:hypothetical protein